MIGGFCGVISLSTLLVILFKNFTAVPYTASLMDCFFATTLDSFAKTSMLRPSGVVQNISVGSVLIKLESSRVESRCILLRR